MNYQFPPVSVHCLNCKHEIGNLEHYLRHITSHRTGRKHPSQTMGKKVLKLNPQRWLWGFSYSPTSQIALGFGLKQIVMGGEKNSGG